MPIRSDSGEILRWFGTNTDITEQKTLTDTLHEEQVLREKFVSTLSHDLRTPLTAAKMSAQLVRRRTEDEKLQSLAFRIDENLNRADMLIQDLLDASKIRAGKGVTPKIQEVDLVDVTRRALDDLSTIHGDRFELRGPRTLPAFLCPLGMRRVIENLCSNAIKYGSERDPVTLTLGESNAHVSLSVYNKGNPLRSVDRQKLFEPFEQGSATQIAGKKGWGIGLTIVKGVAEAHGGRVSVDSSDSGTTFTVLVPKDARGFVREDSTSGLQ